MLLIFLSPILFFSLEKNNVGKSSFLKAYEFFVSSSQKASETDFYNYDFNNPIEIEGVFLKEDSDDENEEFIGKGKTAEPDWITKWVDENKEIRIKKIWSEKNGTFKKSTFSPQDGWVDNGFGGLASLFQKYAPTPICISAMETEGSLEEKVNKFIQDDFLKTLKEEYPEQFNKIIQEIKDLQTKITSSVGMEECNGDLNINFKKVFPNLTLKIEAKHEDNIKLEESFKKNHSVSIRKEGTERSELFSQHGHGVIRQALFNFLSFIKKSKNNTRKEYIILFEEPELFMHPEASFKLRKCLYDLADSGPFQILCATHSPLMIDLSKPHSSLVRVIKSKEEDTETFQVGDEVFGIDEVRKQRVQMINRFNPHICEAFYAEKVLIVEGDTEAIVFRDLIGRFFPDEEIYVLNSGSKNNIPFFQEVLTSFQIEHYVIHDTDTRLNKNGAANSAWTINQSISDKIDQANAQKLNMARRYVHVENFEQAHGVKITGSDKPLKAYEYVITLEQNSDVPCVNFLKDIIGTKEISHTQEYINDNVK